MICNGCGGVVNRDCYNPQECEEIAGDMQESEPDIKCENCGEVGVKVTLYTVFGKEYSSCIWCCEPF